MTHVSWTKMHDCMDAGDRATQEAKVEKSIFAQLKAAEGRTPWMFLVKHGKCIIKSNVKK